jgi:hypothetical protein
MTVNKYADDQADLVDEFYRTYVRALGNMVVLFAQCEADLLALVAELCGSGDDAELDAVRLLKDEKEGSDYRACPWFGPVRL